MYYRVDDASVYDCQLQQTSSAQCHVVCDVRPTAAHHYHCLLQTTGLDFMLWCRPCPCLFLRTNLVIGPGSIINKRCCIASENGSGLYILQVSEMHAPQVQ